MAIAVAMSAPRDCAYKPGFCNFITSSHLRKVARLSLPTSNSTALNTIATALRSTSAMRLYKMRSPALGAVCPRRHPPRPPRSLTPRWCRRRQAPSWVQALSLAATATRCVKNTTRSPRRSMVAEVDTAGAPAAGDVVDRSQLCRSTPVWLSRRLGPPAKCHDEVRISNLCTAGRRRAPRPRRLCDNGLRAAPIGENQSDLLGSLHDAQRS